MSDQKWHNRFMEMAKMVSTWSKDPSTKCGAVIVDSRRRVVSVGFNGFPAGVSDHHELYNHRPTKYKRVIHAEKNAILFSGRDLAGCTLYVYPMPPCSQCAAAIIQSGITSVYYPQPNEDMQSRWRDEFSMTAAMFGEAGIFHRYVGEAQEVFETGRQANK